MLRSITIKNFKLHASTKIEAAPLTVFIGPNNSGKSSVFQAILALQQASSRRQAVFLNSGIVRHSTSDQQPFLYPATEKMDPGSFDDVVRSGQKEIRLSLEGELTDKDPSFGRLRKIKFELGIRENDLDHHSGMLEFAAVAPYGQGKLPWSWSAGQSQQQSGSGPISVRNSQLYFQALPDFRLFQAASFTTPGGHPLSASDTAALSAFQMGLGQAPVDFVNSLHSVYALRGLEESGYPLTAGPESGIDRVMLSDRTLALLSILAYNNDALDEISAWLEDLLRTRIRIKLIPPKRVTLICDSASARAASNLFSNEGTGASQLPFILVPIALCPVGESVMVSEPEAHLHPKAQSELAGLFVRIAKKEGKQFLIETHSEHILNSLLHAVAKGNLKQEDLAIHYFEPRDGTVDVRRLVIDDYGRVEGGLPGFFDQSLNELTEYLETLKKK